VLDLKAVRDNPDWFRTGLGRRGQAEAIDRLLEADARRRELTTRVEALRAEQNTASKAIGSADGPDKQKLIEAVGLVSAELKLVEPELEAVEAGLDRLLAETPNVPHESAADGLEEDDAVELHRGATEIRDFAAEGFTPKDHVALGTALGILDIERAAKVSGSRFVYVLGDMVLLELALVRHALDILMQKGFLPVIPPVLVREEALFGTGMLPDAEDSIYKTQDDLYLVGTSEVSIAGFHMDEILDEADLPLRYAGYSTCFRREAGSHGKDMGGMFRVHQFDKVEMFTFTTPERSWEEHEFILSIEEEIMGNLQIPYRVVNIAVGDLGAPAAKKFDLEAWLPGQDRFRELTSCSNCTDYQARRLNTRYRSGDPALGNVMVHTLNGTATAVGRTMIALLENHQQADGTVVLPEALHPYLPESAHVLTPRT